MFSDRHPSQSLMHKRTRNVVAVFLLVSILWTAIAPHVAHVIAVKTGKAWIELCSATGIKRIEVDRTSVPLGAIVVDDPKAPSSEHKAKQHCLYCSTQHDEVLLALPSASWYLHQAETAQRWPRLELFLPLIRTIWAAHQSRAPPLLSHF